MRSWAMMACACLSVAGTTARAMDSAETAELRRRVTALTAEAEALWIYIQSGPDDPNISAINRALALYDKRRKWTNK